MFVVKEIFTVLLSKFSKVGFGKHYPNGSIFSKGLSSVINFQFSDNSSHQHVAEQAANTRHEMIDLNKDQRQDC